ncbi:MAG: hypothetical protein ACFFAN_04295 [Promethearchaeota archaeon]
MTNLEITNKDINWSLNFIYDMVNQSFETKDYAQALKLSKRGLNEAYKANNKQWINKFEDIYTELLMFFLDRKLKMSLEEATQQEVKSNYKGAISSLQIAKGALLDMIEFVKDQNKIEKQLKTIEDKINDLQNEIKLKSNNLINEVDFEGEPIESAESDTKNANQQEDLESNFQKNVINNPSDKVDTSEEELKLQEFVYDGSLMFDPKYKIDQRSKSRSSKNRNSNEFLKKDNIIEKENTEESVIKLDPFSSKRDNLAEILEKVQKDYHSPVKKEYDTFHGEKLEISYLKNLIKSIAKELNNSKYYIIPKKSRFVKKLFKNVDILALKIIRIKDDLNEILILPIKMCDLKGSLILSDDQIDYKPINPNLKINDRERNILIKNNVLNLRYVQESIFRDLINEGNLFLFFKNYLKINITIEKTITHKQLFFRSGPLQYKILIEPTLACLGEVGFLEKSISFPYLRNSNLHIIKLGDLKDLIEFLEKKYVLIENHSRHDSSINSYFKSRDKFMVDLKLTSIPFLVFGFTFLLAVIFHASFLISLFVNLGYATIAIYSVVLFYMYIKFYKKKSEIAKEFSKPYYKRKVKMDETDLLMISDELSNDLMEQFIYECFGKDINLNFVEKIERGKFRNQDEKITAFMEPEESVAHEFFEDTFNDGTKKNAKKKLEEKLIKKYSSFLED